MINYDIYNVIKNNKVPGIICKLSCVLTGYVILMFFLPAAHADPTDVGGLTISIGEVRAISLNSTSILLSPNMNELLDGRIEQQSWDALVSSNVDWVLTIRGSEEIWDGPWQKPISDILWNYEGSEFTPLDIEPQVVCAGGPSNREHYEINFTVELDFVTDIPGEYHYGYIILELSAP